MRRGILINSIKSLCISLVCPIFLIELGSDRQPRCPARGAKASQENGSRTVTLWRNCVPFRPSGRCYNCVSL